MTAAAAEHSGIPRRLPDWGWDALAVVIILAFAFVPGPRPPMPPPGGPAAMWVPALTAIWFPAAIAALVLLARRRWPIPVYIVTLAIYVATVLLGFADLSAGLAAVIAAYGVAHRTSRRVTLITGGMGAVLITVLSATVADFGVVDPAVFQIAAGVAVASALGDSARSRREYLSAVTERAERAERTREAEAHRRVAEERLRIAQDLHDTVAHQISVISLNAGVAASAVDSRPEKARESLQTIRDAASGVLTEIGGLLRYLRAEQPHAVAPPLVGLQHLDALVDRLRAAGLSVRVRMAGDLSRVIGPVDLVAYRIVQEALTNAHKHGVGTATLELEGEDRLLRIIVANSIAQERSGSAESGEQLGLIGIHERVAAAGGTVELDRSGEEFRLTAELPLQRNGAA